MAEVHDCFTPTELVLMEDLGFSERGTAWKEIEAGTFDLDGELPVNPDGGLKSFGHPVGASGLRMMFEAWLQLRHEAPRPPDRHDGRPHLALTHNLGGYPGEMVSFVGELIGAIAMTEPGTGSDLAGISTTARPDGDDYLLTGSKTFISNGILADVVIVVAKTDPAAGHRGISLLVVERGMAGFERGRNLDKLGMHAQDTAELHFADVRVPRENLLGEEGKGFYYLMEGLAQERLVVSVGGLANAVGVLEQTKTYVRERTAFGQPIGTFQVNRHKLADMHSRIQQAQVFLDRSVELHCRGELDAVEAAMAKYLVSDLQFEVIDECLQLHGGYGFMEEYPVARAFRDCRAQRIYAGTNEVMKDLVGRSLGF
jgi:alkylation response protein AidB-like acyl-CoA dehydrogenase